MRAIEFITELSRVELYTGPEEAGAEVRDTVRNPERTIMLPVRKLITNEPLEKTAKECSTVKDEQIVLNIMNALRKKKTIPPIHVRRVGMKYQVIDGHHRLEAYKRLHIQKIPAQIVTKIRINVHEDQESPPQFVFVIGGAGSGKNYFIRNHPEYSKYQLIDVDQIKLTVPVANAIAAIKPALEDAFKQKQNVVHPATGSHLAGSLNKIKLAEKYGYEVTLILIDTDPTIAAQGVARRVAKGEHNVEPDKIVISNQKAKENFDQLKQYAHNFKIETRT